jgi:hypothetical protein
MYVHCKSHCLNLSIVHSCNDVVSVRNVISTVHADILIISVWVYKEEFEDTKRVIRILISKKNRQYNDQKTEEQTVQ